MYAIAKVSIVICGVFYFSYAYIFNIEITIIIGLKCMYLDVLYVNFYTFKLRNEIFFRNYVLKSFRKPFAVSST